ncbi:uncharacterized protein F4807DRAFT_455989 [Annulohypoxylon truncatum]|uniref:uncharacterized protein n=1 Tax=Annulohypoxylon truncatum TaxID=327061 RepID=UPI0020082B4D|nr:uncharacterized protein F4807DRAFT_455989 [Annulohypoxylon truncatum]KAI1214349.1 hypothetical protein F4807DRAFT_455989 [Annulohypoxylon truncatum]
MDKKGYSKIALFMQDHPEDAMVRRFAALNLQNILYLQAEVINLQRDLDKLETDNDSSVEEDRRNFALDWYTLAHVHDTPGSDKQWKKWLQLRKALEEYNTAIMQYCQLSKLPASDQHELQKLQSWLSETRLGNVYLLGRDHDVWSQGKDLMTLALSPHDNRFSRFVANKALPLYHRLGHSTIMERIRDAFLRSRGSASATSVDTGIATYDDAGLVLISQFICTVIASLLPILSIIVLYLVENMGHRLALVAVFCVLFSSALWFMNDGELVEVFGATSAFAAVQVVFISTSSA